MKKALFVALVAAAGIAGQAAAVVPESEGHLMVPAEIVGERFAELRSNVPIGDEGESAKQPLSADLVVAKEEVGQRLPETDIIGEAPHTTLSSDQVDQVARYVLLGARASRCAGKGEYCDLVIKSCKDDDCAKDEPKQEGSEATEESTEAAESSEESLAAESSSEESSSSELSEKASGSGPAPSESSEESSEESTIAQLSKAEKAALQALQN